MKRTSFLLFATFVLGACGGDSNFDPRDPARGPGSLVGNGDPVSDGNFVGGNDSLPAARTVSPPTGENTPVCDSDCRSYCDGLALENPINRGLCPALWGVGMQITPVIDAEACRRLYIDTIGVSPDLDTISAECAGRQWGAVVRDLLATEEHIHIVQRRYADTFLYDVQSSNVESIFDLDELVGKLERGLVSFDEFAAVASAHPAIMRRYATPEDIAEAIFTQFLGRPPFDFERSDFARLYALWEPGYIDHIPLAQRIPDGVIDYQCVDEYGYPDPNLEGLCTSTQFGLHRVILAPDFRSTGQYGRRQMWSGLLTPEEWFTLQTPGRVLAAQPAFWEKAVQDILVEYLGYDLGALVPEVRQELVNYLLQYNGDIRAVHFAVATSFAYLQSSIGATPSQHRWKTGPRKQLLAEDWMIKAASLAQVELPLCDHRISRPNMFMDTSAGRAMINASRWQVDSNGNIETDYANLARALGGCPTNEADRRARFVSLLTTSSQLNFAKAICDPTGDSETEVRANTAELLPAGVSETAAVDLTIASQIATHLTQTVFGRNLSGEEQTSFDEAANQCMASTCSAEDFSRVACFVLLASAENLFY